MDDLAKRMAALSPEQRELLQLRLTKKGLQSQLSTDATTAIAGSGPAETVNAAANEDPQAWKLKSVERAMRFSLYFFSDDGSKTSGDKYRLVLESAKFADRQGFSAIWTPERHFQAFGGLYPNPSVLSAALAMITERIQIRAGSVALPLHHPVRVAEEWSVVDNLSRGRVAVSFASGWHPDDFIFAPEAYEDRKEVMFRHIETIRQLWAGESVTWPGVGGHPVTLRILPRPIQESLPIWITTAGSPATWTRAGEIGANILAALVGYSLEDLAERIGFYREARARHGHDPQAGIVSIMLHTFIGDDNDAVKEKVRAPFSNYLRTYFKQYENVHLDPESTTEADKETLIAVAFENYFQSGTLMGTNGKCAQLIERLAAIDVDEAACLIDFGVDTDSVIESLARLNELREHFDSPRHENSRQTGGEL
jgi:natural product biosynthesis luciferase-like monooxygenase protein